MSGTDERQSPATDWPAAWAALALLDGDAWDDEADRLDQLWKAEYRTAFVDHALTRPGWTRGNAEGWADEIAADALCTCRGQDRSPKEVAEVDVIECEKEWSNA